MKLISRNAKSRVVVLATLVSFNACSSNEITEPQPSFTLLFNGAPETLPGSARVVRYPGGADSLVVGGYRDDLAVHTWVEYTGPGTYTLGTYDAVVQMLVGGDGVSGYYFTTSEASGTLSVSEADEDGFITATLSFDAESTGGDPRYGTTLQVRDGVLRTRLTFQDAVQFNRAGAIR